MPLYTYIISYKNETKISLQRRSNYVGFILEPIAATFPELRLQFGALMRMKPEPIANAKRTWGFSLDISGHPFTLHVVETRD